MSGLKGKRVLVTRDFRQSKSFCQQLEAVGAIPVVIPLIEIVHQVNGQEKQQLIENFLHMDWIIFTSTNGVEHFFQEFSPKSFDFSQKKFAVVGKATERCLKSYGFGADFVPPQYTGQCLVNEMHHYINKNDTILFVKGKIAGEMIPDHLTKEGYHFQLFTVYDTVQNQAGKKRLIEMLQNGALDILTFTSPSAVRSFIHCLSGTGLLDGCNERLVAVIGPTSRDAAEALGLKVSIMPDAYTIPSMVEAIHRYFE